MQGRGATSFIVSDNLKFVSRGRINRITHIHFGTTTSSEILGLIVYVKGNM